MKDKSVRVNKFGMVFPPEVIREQNKLIRGKKKRYLTPGKVERTIIEKIKNKSKFESTALVIPGYEHILDMAILNRRASGWRVSKISNALGVPPGYVVGVIKRWIVRKPPINQRHKNRAGKLENLSRKIRSDRYVKNIAEELIGKGVIIDKRLSERERIAALTGKLVEWKLANKWYADIVAKEILKRDLL